MAKPTRDGRPVVRIDNYIKIQKFPNIYMSNKTIIDFESQGGNPEAMKPLVDWFKAQLRGARPTVIVRRLCASTCIGVLATLNNMAGKNQIELIVDTNTIIGFHGCLNLDTGEHEKVCSMKMIQYLNSQGVDLRWLYDHPKLFVRPTKEYLVKIKADDPGFRNSGLLDHARLERSTADLLK